MNDDAEPDNEPRPKARRAEPGESTRRRYREDPDEPYRRDNEGDATGGLIPYKNPKALIGYYVSIFGFFLPLLGSIAAIILGFQGMAYAKKNPAVKGTAHAVIAIVLGILGTLFWGMIALVAIVATLSK